MTSAPDFYDVIASDYDSMTRFHQRLKSEEEVLRRWRDRYSFDSVLDAACGTGLHAIVLARLGVKTAAADPSRAMLEVARRHASEVRVEVPFVEADFAALDARFSDRFGAVLVLGNSLPHVHEESQLTVSLRGLAAVMDGSGILVLQLLNYERILAQKERIVGVNRDRDNHFVRFYDFLGDLVQFNILVLRTEGDKVTHRLSSTILRPYRLAELAPALKAAGLRNVETFGDMTFSPFDPVSSPNLVIVARR
ncbi:MAG: class I SAM-dependent methyltransferase [Acidobacteria bacterium]|nr:MAG: class I SAM-dependent methyltransferase [Acidobacteriota bacterium]